MKEIVVDKTRRILSLVADGQTVASFPVLVGRNPGPKRSEGDGRTPKGRYAVLRLLPDEEAVGKGYYKGLHVSYPSVVDAESGRKRGQIDDETHRQIFEAHQAGEIPPQETALGGYVAIHGGLAPDERFERGTKGCIVMRNADLDRVYAFADPGTPILIHDGGTFPPFSSSLRT